MKQQERGLSQVARKSLLWLTQANYYSTGMISDIATQVACTSGCNMQAPSLRAKLKSVRCLTWSSFHLGSNIFQWLKWIFSTVLMWKVKTWGSSSSNLNSLQPCALLLCSSGTNDYMCVSICQKHPKQLRGNLSMEDLALCGLLFAPFL